MDIYSHAPVSILTLRNLKDPKNDLDLDCPTYENNGRLELQRNLAATCQWLILKQDLEQAGSRKQLLNFIKTGMAERAKTKDPDTMDMDTIWSDNSNLLG